MVLLLLLLLLLRALLDSWQYRSCCVFRSLIDGSHQEKKSGSLMYILFPNFPKLQSYNFSKVLKSHWRAFSSYQQPLTVNLDLFCIIIVGGGGECTQRTGPIGVNRMNALPIAKEPVPRTPNLAVRRTSISKDRIPPAQGACEACRP